MINPKDYGIGDRTIKFRAWNAETEEMLSWADILDTLCGRISDPFNFDGFTVMQYTGIKDKNGKESYEGDIYSCGHEYSDGTHKYGDRNVISNVRTFEPEDSFEVIGNIFENEDLLTKENA